MKVTLEKFSPGWAIRFALERAVIERSLAFNPVIEHIGSTAVEGMWAKPVIDVLVGIPEGWQPDATVPMLTNAGFTYVSRFTEAMPYRRFFVRLDDSGSIEEITATHNGRFGVDFRPVTHVHVLHYGSDHWIRHVAFRDYIRAHPAIAREYSMLKQRISLRDLADSLEYNSLKEDFILDVQARAVDWYRTKSRAQDHP